MLIPLVSFTGEFPRTNAYAIPDNAAQYSRDCNFLKGSLTGLKTNGAIVNFPVAASVRSIFVYSGGASAGQTYAWNRDVDAVRSPNVQDKYRRFYWSDNIAGQLCVSDGGIGGAGQEPTSANKYKVGVPAPTAPMTSAVSTQTLSLGGFDAAIGAAAPLPSYTFLFSVADELSDGSAINLVTMAIGTVTQTATSQAWALTARAPQPVAGSSSTLETTTTTTTEIDPITGQTVTTVTESTGSVNSVSPVVGPVVYLQATRRSDGQVFTATLRLDASKSVIPPELGNIAISMTNSGTSWAVKAGADSDVIESRDYTYTYVNLWQEEGPPSLPATINCSEVASIKLTVPALPAAIAGFGANNANGYATITKVRVYRTANGGGQNYLFVGEFPISAGLDLIDANPSGTLNEPLTTFNYYPPAQDIKGLCVMTNGMMAGFRGNEVHICEPYLPYACNPNTIKPLPHQIVSIIPFENGLYVTTTANPYILMGASPDTITDAKVPAVQGGVSKGGICDMGQFIAYASNDGVVAMRGLEASLDKSFQFFTREEWRSRYGALLKNIRLTQFDGSLLVWFDDVAATPGFLMRFEEEAPSYTRLSQSIYAAYTHPDADSLYLSDGSAIVEFKTGATTYPFVWWSKVFRAPKPINLGVVQLVGTGTVLLEAFAGGVLQHSESVVVTNPGTLVRLPSGFLERDWSFRLTGSAGAEVEGFYIATTVDELRNV